MRNNKKLYYWLIFALIIVTEAFVAYRICSIDYSWTVDEIGESLSSSVFKETTSRIDLTDLDEHEIAEVIYHITNVTDITADSEKASTRLLFARILNSKFSVANELDIDKFAYIFQEEAYDSGMTLVCHFHLVETSEEGNHFTKSSYHSHSWDPFPSKSFTVPINEDGTFYINAEIGVIREIIRYESPYLLLFLIPDVLFILLIMLINKNDRKRKELAKSEKEFSNRIIHDLRNPLSVAFMSTELLINRAEEKGDSEMKELSGFIFKHLQLMDEKIEEVLTMIRGKKN